MCSLQHAIVFLWNKTLPCFTKQVSIKISSRFSQRFFRNHEIPKYEPVMNALIQNVLWHSMTLRVVPRLFYVPAKQTFPNPGSWGPELPK